MKIKIDALVYFVINVSLLFMLIETSIYYKNFYIIFVIALIVESVFYFRKQNEYRFAFSKTYLLCSFAFQFIFTLGSTIYLFFIDNMSSESSFYQIMFCYGYIIPFFVIPSAFFMTRYINKSRIQKVILFVSVIAVSIILSFCEQRFFWRIISNMNTGDA